MGKTPKKAAPGGDERNLYVRRLKATTGPSRASETSLPERQRETENSNRPKLSGVQKRIPQAQGKGFKSKLRGPAKLGSNHPPKRLNKPPGTSKQAKTIDFSVKDAQANVAEMQPESEEAEVKLDVSTEKKNRDEVNVEESKNEIVTEEKCVEHASTDDVTVSTEQMDSNKSESVKEVESSEVQPESQENQSDAKSTVSNQSKEIDEQDDNDIKLSFETEESPAKQQEEISIEKGSKDENKADESHPIQVETKNGTSEKEDVQSESQTDVESCSVDIVESTTSELSETSEAVSQNDTPREEKLDEAANNDPSFVSYDSSIMLKDVKIKLNDCLKENSKLFDVSSAEYSTPNKPLNDMSFGKTLRNISGRSSINRMRHVTLREQRFSPNSSLFVNTSGMSLPQDDTADYKILRYSTGVSDALSTNGSSVERKRKLETGGWNSAKKPKTESENSLFNTSISLLKGLRRPIQVSTPTVEAYKYTSSKLDISGLSEDESKIINEPMEGTRKWCVIM